MKRVRSIFLLSLFAAILSSSFAEATPPPPSQNTISGWVQNTFKLRTNSAQKNEALYRNPNIDIFAVHQFKDSRWSFATFACAYKNWAEALVGARYAFSNYFFLGAYTGVEFYNTYPNPKGRDANRDWWRFAIEGRLRIQNFSWYNVYEIGSHGWAGDYWTSEMNFAVHPYIRPTLKVYNIGLDYWKYGGGVIFTIPKTPLAIAPIYLNLHTRVKGDTWIDQGAFEAILYFRF
ncbi:MAG: hypothetical protein JW913_11410 [Chitinispirillaceae bacterium]|nr:hypothetical protein [Chitinispirillaceae bacterium]